MGKVDKMNKYIEFSAVLLFASMVFIVFTQITLRYLFDYAFSWAEELARYMQIWLTFLGASLAFHKFSHVNIVFFISKLPVKIQTSVFVIVQILSLSFLGLLVYKGLALSQFGWTLRSPALGIPMTAIYIALPCCSIFMGVNIFSNLLNLINSNKKRI